MTISLQIYATNDPNTLTSLECDHDVLYTQNAEGIHTANGSYMPLGPARTCPHGELAVPVVPAA